MSASIVLGLREFTWDAPPSAEAHRVASDDGQFVVHYDKAEKNIPLLKKFGKLFFADERHDVSVLSKEFNILNPGGYVPVRDFVLECRDVTSTPILNKCIYVTSKGSYYRCGGRIDDEEKNASNSDDPSALDNYISRFLNRRKPVVHIKGITIALNIWTNWDHFVRQCVTSIVKCVEYAGLDSLKDVSLIASNLNDRAQEFIEEIGIPRENIYKYKEAVFKHDRLLICDGNHRLVKPSPLYVRTSDFVLKHLNVASDGPEKIYVSRKLASRRRIVNEEAVENYYSAMGFVCVDPGAYTYAEQVKLFANAKVIVGPHGMGLASAIFAPKLKLLVEIMPTSWLRVSYLRTAQVRGAAYGVFIVNPSADDEITVDIDRLDAFVRSLDETPALLPPRQPDAGSAGGVIAADPAQTLASILNTQQQLQQSLAVLQRKIDALAAAPGRLPAVDDLSA